MMNQSPRSISSMRAENLSFWRVLHDLRYTDGETWQLEQLAYDISSARIPLPVGSVMNAICELAQQHLSVDAIADQLWGRKTW